MDTHTHFYLDVLSSASGSVILFLIPSYAALEVSWAGRRKTILNTEISFHFHAGCSDY